MGDDRDDRLEFFRPAKVPVPRPRPPEHNPEELLRWTDMAPSPPTARPEGVKTSGYATQVTSYGAATGICHDDATARNRAAAAVAPKTDVRTCFNEAWAFSPKEVMTHRHEKRRKPDPGPERRPDNRAKRLEDAEDAAGCFRGAENDHYGQELRKVYPGGTPYKVQPSLSSSVDMAAVMGMSPHDPSWSNHPEIERRGVTGLSAGMCQCFGMSEGSQFLGKDAPPPSPNADSCRFSRPVPQQLTAKGISQRSAAGSSRRAFSEDLLNRRPGLQVDRHGEAASRAATPSLCSFGSFTPSSRTPPGEVSEPPSDCLSLASSVLSTSRRDKHAHGPYKHGQTRKGADVSRKALKVNAAFASSKYYSPKGGSFCSGSSTCSERSLTSFDSVLRSERSRGGYLSAR